MTESVNRRLSGDWMDRGYVSDQAPRCINIRVEGGQAFTNEPMLMEQFALPLVDGELVWSSRVTFLPDDGELQRVGLA